MFTAQANFRYFDEMETAQNPTFGEKTKQFFGRCFTEVTSFTYEISLLVAGVVSIFFLPQLAIPLFAMAGGSLISKLATKIINRYDNSAFATFEYRIWKFHQTYEKWHLMAGLVVLAVGFFIPYVGSALCVGFGLYNGLIMEMQMCRTLQEKSEMDDKDGIENALGRLVV